MKQMLTKNLKKVLVLSGNVQGASLVDQMIKNLAALQETRVESLGWEDPGRRGWLPTPVFLPGVPHGQESLAGSSLWGPRVRHD